ncbi:MAG: universal stress protein [Thermodesulfobacterium sp.]|nr:universal stress protein [Thermodesulfobacterium sp.]
MVIVVAYDGSEDVKEGLRQLPKFLEGKDDKVYLLYVVAKREDMAKEEVSILKEKGKNLLEEGKSLLPQDFPSEAILLEDYSVAEAILNYVNKVSADLLIMGARGTRPDVIRYTLGSTASKVSAFAPCSVYIVRKRPKTE